MIKRLCKFFNEIPKVVNLSKTELLLALSTCTMIGVVIGMFISPRKTQYVGCDNGNNYFGTDDDAEDIELEFEE